VEDVVVLVLRVVLGVLLIGHGSQKLFGWFGGYGLTGTGGFMESLGMKPGRVMAAAAGLSEFVGGALLVVGFLVPVGALLIAGVMTVAIGKVHIKNGPWNEGGGYEFPLLIVLVVVTLAVLGPGAVSLAGALGVEDTPVLGAVL